MNLESDPAREVRTARWGSNDVAVLEKKWISKGQHPYRKTYALNLGQSWFEAETTTKQWEYYVWCKGDAHVPVGAIIADELATFGANLAVFVEIWGSCVLVDHNLNCVAAGDDVCRLDPEHPCCEWQ